MIVSLLFQNQIVHSVATTSNSLIGVYIALSGTLVASIIAAIASIRASNKASITAREVVELSNKTAQELKDKEFRNDYYKKVIDRRLLAYETLEKIVLSLSRRNIITLQTSVGMCTHEIYSFFAFEDEFDKFHIMTTDILEKTLWFSTDLKKEIVVLQNAVANVGLFFEVYVDQKIGDEQLRLAGVKHDEEFKAIRKRMVRLIRKEIIEIQNINNFFVGLEEPVEDD